MERKEVQSLMRRIKTNYNEFVIDDYSVSEWYKELKDYDLKDVMEKLEQHFRSETYGSQAPKVYFLTKYLTKTQDKNKKNEYLVRCEICGAVISLNDYDKHRRRCQQLEYLEKKSKELLGKDFNKEKAKVLSEETFNKLYDSLVDKFYDKETGKEKDYLRNEILTRDGQELDLTLFDK